MKAIVVACLASLIALPALARDPQPKPSNITIHLFGPDLITQTNASGTSSTGQNADGSGTGNASSEPQPEPTLHQVLHEMFVTGDPEQDKKPHFPPLKGASK